MTELPDRLVRETLEDAATTPSSRCLDADSLAAWADGAMRGTERAAIETHAASCERCQALLAAMVRTEPPAIERAWWRRPAWVLPFATAAVAVAIVVGVAVLQPERRSQPASASAEAPSRPPSVLAAPPAVNAPAPAEAAAPATTPSQIARAATPGRHRSIDVAPQSPAAALQKETNAAAPPVPGLSASAPAAAKDAAAPAATPALPSSPVAAPSPAPPYAPAAAAATVRDETTRAERAQAFAAQPMMKAVAPVPLVIASPDRASRWRLAGGTVEHTTDGGQSWQPQSTGVVAPMLAGAAPGARVCWLAGTGGVVLRTTDGGATWTRLAAADHTDLVAIEAPDETHATVTTAAGRRFATRDGGATWTPQ
jgi:hypothetical protein